MHPYSSNRQTQPILGGPRGICAEITIGYPRRFRPTAVIYVSCEGVLIEWYGRDLVVVGRLWRFGYGRRWVYMGTSACRFGRLRCNGFEKL